MANSNPSIPKNFLPDKETDRRAVRALGIVGTKEELTTEAPPLRQILPPVAKERRLTGPLSGKPETYLFGHAGSTSGSNPNNNSNTNTNTGCGNTADTTGGGLASLPGIEYDPVSEEKKNMAFCPNCGAQADGSFCAKCGTAVQSGAAPPPPSAPGAAGLSSNVAALLCYVFTLVSGVIFLVLEPYNRDKNIRFHAFQAIFFGISAIVLMIGLSVATAILFHIPVVGWVLAPLLSMIVWVGYMVVWIMLMVKAYNGERWVLPVIGPMAEKQA